MVTKSAQPVVQAYWRHTKKYPLSFVLATSGVFIQQIVNVISPLYLRTFFNDIATLTPSAQSVALALTPLIMYAILGLIGWAGGRIEMAFGLRVIASVAKDLTQESFNYLMRHSWQFFSSSFSGALTRRISKYADSYERIYYSLQTSIVPAALYILGATGVLLYRNLALGSILFVWIVVFVGVQWFMVRLQQPLRVARSEADTGLTAVLADSISNQNTVALFAGNKYEETMVHSASERLHKALVRMWAFDIWFYGVQGLLAIAANVGLLYVALIYWQAGQLTLGDLVLIQAYVFGLLNYVWGIGREFRIIYTTLADAAEMVAILQTPYEIQDAPGAKSLTITKGSIDFKDVVFHFHNNTSILTGLTLHIGSGERLALVGPSGAGKSTITKLLLRLYDVKSGSILIDGQNIAQVTQDSLRNAIAFVPQEPILFHRTLMENIRYGRRDASDAEVMEAAKKAHCHEFISKLPLAYGTFVGERGIKLSGGERQRVAIARAILKDSPILILDEATSSLDSESEALIQDALETLMKGKTVIVIAHRLSTIMKMDRIIVLEGGSVVAQGTHNELLAQDGLYQKLWSIQAGGFIGLSDEPNLKSLKDEDAQEEKSDDEEPQEDTIEE